MSDYLKIFTKISAFALLWVLLFPSAVFSQDMSKLKVELVGITTGHQKNSILSFEQEFEGNITYLWWDQATNQTKITSVNASEADKKFGTISLGLTNKTEFPTTLLHAKRSPTGVHFAFGVGAITDTYSWYNLFVLDTRTGKIQSLGVASYKEYFWSPDGRFLSYIQNGDIQGQVKDEKYPLQLRLYDTASLTVHPIVSSRYLANSFCWSAPHNLYYAIPEELPATRSSQTLKPDSALPLGLTPKPTRPKPTEPKLGLPNPAQTRPNLYLYSMETKKAALLFRDCYRPTISDDGSKVAFYGEEQPQSQSRLPPKWQSRANYMTLCISDLSGKNRKAIHMERGDYPLLQWSASGNSILTLKETVPGPNAQMEIVKWNAQSGIRESRLTLKVNDEIVQHYAEEINRPEITRRFIFLGRYKNQDKLLISSKKYVELTATTLKMETVMNQVDLDRGLTEQLLTARQAEGAYTPMDWTH